MAGRGIVIKIEGDGESARQALAMVREQLQETGESAKETGSVIENAFERATRAIEYVGIYAGIREAGDALKETVSRSLEYGEAMVQAAQKTGLSVESMSVLHYASGLLGGDFDALVTGIGRMQKNLSDAATGNKQLAADFSAIGVNAKQAAGSTDGAQEAFHKFVTAIANAKDVQTQNRLAMDLMGKSGIAQVPVLIEIAQHWDELAERAESAGMVLNANTAESLARVNQLLADMKMRIAGDQLQLTEGLAPALAQVTQSFNVGRESEQGFADTGAALGAIFKVVVTVFDAVALAVREVTDQIIGDVTALKDVGSVIVDAWKGNWAGVKSDWQQAASDQQGVQQTMLDNARRFRDQFKALWLDDAPTKPLAKGPGGNSPTIPTIPTRGRSGNNIADAAAALAAEQAKAAADAQKDADQQQLAELDTQHKMLLVSDQHYYAEKLRLQLDEIDAEENALRSRQATLQQLLERQHNDKTLKRDSSGNSAEELKTERELLQIQEQMAALEARRGQANSANAAEANQANLNAELAGLRAAAELEKQRNDGITAQIALLERETQLSVQKAAAAGTSGDTQAQIRANGQLLEQKLRIADVDRQIEQTEAQFNAAAKEIEDREAKGQISKLQAERELNALHQQEVAVLQSLVQQYDALAATLGGPFLEKAQELHAALSELSTPDKSKEPQFGKTIGESVTKMADTLISQSIRGKESFHQMVKEVEADAAELALKLIAMKFLGGGGGGAAGAGGSGGSGGGDGWMSGLGGIFSALFKNLPHFAAGGSPDGPSIVGEEGPELWTPPSKGGTITPNGVLTKIADSGGGGRTPNITTNVINQSSQPVTVQQSQTDYDSQAHEFVQQVVLKDLASNGPIRQGFGAVMGAG